MYFKKTCCVRLCLWAKTSPPLWWTLFIYNLRLNVKWTLLHRYTYRTRSSLQCTLWGFQHCSVVRGNCIYYMWYVPLNNRTHCTPPVEIQSHISRSYRTLGISLLVICRCNGQLKKISFLTIKSINEVRTLSWRIHCFLCWTLFHFMTNLRSEVISLTNFSCNELYQFHIFTRCFLFRYYMDFYFFYINQQLVSKYR